LLFKRTIDFNYIKTHNWPTLLYIGICLFNFNFELIEECEISLLPSIENYWMNLLKSFHSDFGYNIGIGNPNGNSKLSDITKLKTVAKTAAINELDKVIAAEEQRGVGRNTSVETSQKTEGILSLLERATRK
jgi:hypothetical protein